MKNALHRLSLVAHRRLWQTLPPKLRRVALVRATAALAPRPAADARPAPLFIVAGFLTAATGLGTSARLCHDALRAAGLPVMGIDLTARFRQDDNRVAFSFTDASNHRGAATLILHTNAPFVPLALWWLGRRFLDGKFVVGYWAWELPAAPPEWRAGLPFVHHILAPSTFTAAALKGLGARQPVDVLAHPVALAPPPLAGPSPSLGPFRVLVILNVASGLARKNPMASVSAFLKAFGHDPGVRLLIKVQGIGSFASGAEELRRVAERHANIVLDERNLSAEEMAQLYASADVVMSLHRSEGFGLVIAEAMLAGRPVIATDWSGSTDFLTAGNGVPVSYSLVPTVDPQGTYHNPSSYWAEPDVIDAAAALRGLRVSSELRVRVGQAAAAQAAHLFSLDRYVARLKELLGLS